jgi:hypothetical protein
MLDRQVWYPSDAGMIERCDDSRLIRLVAEALFVGAANWAQFIAGFIRDESVRERAMDLSVHMEAA